jgi:hypothetical protein
MTTSNALIQSLVEDLKPVRRLASVDLRTVLWAGFAVACVCFGTYALGVRSDLALKLHDPSYLVEGAALLMSFALATRSAFQLSVPGVERGRLSRMLPLAMLLGWALLIAIRGARGMNEASFTPVSSGSSCAFRMTFLAFAPTLWLLFMLGQAAPLRPGWTGLFALVSASALGMLGTQALCVKDAAMHLLYWHVGPVLIAGLVGLCLGELFLSRSQAHSRGP